MCASHQARASTNGSYKCGVGNAVQGTQLVKRGRLANIYHRSNARELQWCVCGVNTRGAKAPFQRVGYLAESSIDAANESMNVCLKRQRRVEDVSLTGHSCDLDEDESIPQPRPRFKKVVQHLQLERQPVHLIQHIHAQNNSQILQRKLMCEPSLVSYSTVTQPHITLYWSRRWAMRRCTAVERTASWN